jgi:hypothetical protein
MEEGVPVRCPSCGRTHTFTASVYPCACGAPVTPPLLTGAPPETITHRTWADEWVKVRCGACGRQGHWPQPELGCACGSVLRVPVRPVGEAGTAEDGAGEGGQGEMDQQNRKGRQPDGDDTARAAPDVPPGQVLLPRPVAAPRPTFRPLTIRTSRDAVTAAALYLRWLGFHGIVQAGEQPASGIDLRGPEVVAQVDPSTSPASLRSVECLWLNGLNASAVSVFFSLAGYAEDARARADDLGVPLFVLDLTGAPQPVNGPADELILAGA